MLAACAQAGSASPAPPGAVAGREAVLAAALPMPAPSQYEAHYLQWQDAARERTVPAKLYLPARAQGPVPLVVFSHGIGGSREGYTYLGKYWAANGYASLHLQHTGSDRNLWAGNPLALVTRLQGAAQEAEAMNRARDVSFALDQLLAGELAGRIDPLRIAAAGHSYGANTTLLAAGAQVVREGRAMGFADARIRAAVVISAPPFYGEADPQAILSHVRVPTLHITSTADDIRIPGYYSGVEDRAAVYASTGSARKALAVFKDGSHSMFTDRLGTGGAQWNPQVKAATRELALDFLRSVFDGQPGGFEPSVQRHQALLQRFEHRY
ncbi:MAG: alpha/beta hydrolase family protein [Ramlibacter sp.]